MADNEASIDPSKMKVAELRHELKIRNLKSIGNKQELVSRLQEHFSKDSNILSESIGDDDIINEEEFLNDVDEEIKDHDISKDTDSDLLDGSLVEDLFDNTNATTQETLDVPELSETSPQEKSNATVSVKSPITLDEKLKLRAKRFDINEPTDDKKVERAKRFGLSNANSTQNSKSKIVNDVQTDIDLLKKRAERFGANVSNVLKKQDEEDKMRKRKARFGDDKTTSVIQNSATLDSTDSENIKKLKRAERFKV